MSISFTFIHGIKRRDLMVIRTACIMFLGVMTACSTKAERTAESIKSVVATVKQQMQSCVANAAFGHSDIAVHIPLDGVTKPTLLQQADASIPTTSEIRSLALWHSDIQKCREVQLGLLRPVVASVALVVENAYTKADSIYLALLQRRITWGVANQQLVQVRNELAQGIATASVQLGNDLQRADTAEREQRAAALAALGQAAAAAAQAIQQQQLINQINRPITTNCNRFGTTVNCITY